MTRDRRDTLVAVCIASTVGTAAILYGIAVSAASASRVRHRARRRRSPAVFQVEIEGQ